MNMNPNDFMGYQQGQQPQQPMQMPNFNPSMQMQPNFGKGLPNYNPSNMQMNRQNAMNQFQAMQFQGIPNPMNQMQPGGMPNPINPSMNQNMMKQHNMMQPTGPSFGFTPQSSRHRSSLTGMQFNNSQMFPQMMQTQSGSQPPTTAILPSQANAQPKKKRSSSTAAPINANNTSNNPSNSNASNNNASNSKNLAIAPSSSIDNISGSASTNTNNTTSTSSSAITDSAQEKAGNNGSSRGSISKSGSGNANQQKHSMMSNQANLNTIGSIGSMNNLTAMSSMNSLNMGLNNMNSMGNLGNLSSMNSISGMNSMGNMNAMNMNMNMNMGMNMGMPLGGMNMNNMNVMNGMGMMNNMSGINPMSSGIGLSGMSSIGNISGIGSMSGINSMSSMGSMTGMGNMGNIGSMSGMTGISPSTTNPSSSSSIPQAPPASSSSSQSQPQPQPQPTQPSNQQTNQPSSQQPPSQPQQPTPQSQQQQQQAPQSQSQQQQQQPVIPTISVPPQIQAQMSAIPQIPMMVGPGGISPDVSRMTILLAKLIEEKADLFFSLFDIHQGKKRDEKIEFFIKYVMKNFHPSWFQFTLAFLEQIQQSPVVPYSNQSAIPLSVAVTPQSSGSATTNTSSTNATIGGSSSQPNSTLGLTINPFLKFREPQLPMVFSRVKGCKPSFKNLVLNKNKLEFAPNKNSRSYTVIGSFISANEKIDPSQYSVTVFCGSNEIQPLNFGENESYYLLFSDTEKVPPRFTVEITSQSANFPPSFLTWFTCQYVKKRNAKDIVASLLKAAMPSTTQNEKNQIARTPMCNGCSFYAIDAVEEILNNGFAVCPACHANINLNDLIFDSTAAAPPQQIKIEENKEMRQGRISCSDALTSLMKPPHTEPDWPSILFDQGGLKSDKYEPMVYSNTSEFRNELSHFKYQSFS